MKAHVVSRNGHAALRNESTASVTWSRCENARTRTRLEVPLHGQYHNPGNREDVMIELVPHKCRTAEYPGASGAGSKSWSKSCHEIIGG